MSDRHTGMQARLKDVNPLAVYIPCSAHSLNLVGVSAVDCCVEVINFFGFVLQLYNFFSASTHRWAILTAQLDSNELTVNYLKQDGQHVQMQSKLCALVIMLSSHHCPK